MSIIRRLLMWWRSNQIIVVNQIKRWGKSEEVQEPNGLSLCHNRLLSGKKLYMWSSLEEEFNVTKAGFTTSLNPALVTSLRQHASTVSSVNDIFFSCLRISSLSRPIKSVNLVHSLW